MSKMTIEIMKNAEVGARGKKFIFTAIETGEEKTLTEWGTEIKRLQRRQTDVSMRPSVLPN